MKMRVENEIHKPSSTEIQMTNTGSLFTQVLSLFQRSDFARHVRQLKAERHARGFTCWSQFVSMLFCQLAQARSLREIADGLKCCEGKLKHLGITAPSRSTLAKNPATESATLSISNFLKPGKQGKVRIDPHHSSAFRNPAEELFQGPSWR